MTGQAPKKPFHHTSQIYPEVRLNIEKRRGNVHLYSDFDPSKTALLVIDMQNCWLVEGQPGYQPYAHALVPNINRVADTLRDAGGIVVWVQMNTSPQVTAVWHRFRDIVANELDAWHAALTPGSVGFDLWSGLHVLPADVRVVKNRYSAFIQGASTIHEELQQRGADTVLVAGVATNTCCESTARDAQMMNYKVIMISDATATGSDLEHSAALSNLVKNFADVRSTDEVIARLENVIQAKRASAKI